MKEILNCLKSAKEMPLCLNCDKNQYIITYTWIFSTNGLNARVKKKGWPYPNLKCWESVTIVPSAP